MNDRSAPAPVPETFSSPSSEKEIAAYWRAMTPSRMYDYGVLPDDIVRMQKLTSEGAAWDVAAESLADAQERRSVEALESGHRQTAVTALRACAADLIFAQMSFNFDTQRKRDLYDRLTATLQKLADLSGDGLTKIELPFGTGLLTGWLVRPDVSAVGTVVAFGGQSGWGAAYWRTAEALAARGIATIMAEGPGQGETRLRHGVFLDVDVSEAYSTYISFIEDDPSLGAPGILGNSLGGLFAALTAARDERVAACCVNGAPARPALLGFRGFDEQAAAMLGTDDTERIEANFQRLTFDPLHSSIDCPLLVLHGGADVLFNLDAQRPFLDGARRDHMLRVWPDGDHTIYNHCEERSSVVADWFLDQFTAPPQRGVSSLNA